MKNLSRIFGLLILAVNLSGIAMDSSDKKLSLFDYSVITDANLTRAAIDAGEDVNGVNSEGLTPLRYAIKSFGKDRLEVLKILISKGANVNYQNQISGWTALHDAFSLNYSWVSWGSSELPKEIEQGVLTKVTELLIESGAKPFKDNIDRTPLMTVAPEQSWPYMFGIIDKFYQWEAQELSISAEIHLQNVRNYTTQTGRQMIQKHNHEKEMGL